MLFEALFVPPGGAPFARSVLDQPEIAHYVSGFGAEGDLGVVALDAEGRPLGAAWVRRLAGDDRGYGWFADDIPELTIAVAPEHRREGVGTALLSRLLGELRGSTPAVSLSVDRRSPARRLYERFGFVEVGSGGTSLTMLLDLSAGGAKE